MGENIQNDSLVLLPTACFPSLLYLQDCNKYKLFGIEAKEHYVKQTIRNRYIVQGPNGLIALTIPVNKPNGNKTKTKDILLDSRENWRKIHLETLKTAYGNSPYFEHYIVDVEKLFQEEITSLLEWNNLTLQFINEHLELNLKHENTTDYTKASIDCRLKDYLPKWKKEAQSVQNISVQPYLSVLHYLFEQGPMTRDLINLSSNLPTLSKRS